MRRCIGSSWIAVTLALGCSAVSAPTDSAAHTFDSTFRPPVFDALDAQQNCIGNFMVQSMRDLDELRHCRTITGNLVIRSTSVVSSLEPLRMLSSIGGNLEICDQSNLASFAGLQHLTEVAGHIEIHQNRGLLDISDLNALARIEGTIEISDNPSLATVRLLSLRTLGGELLVQRNPMLSTLEFDALTAYGRALQISDNARLPECAVARLASRLAVSCACANNSGDRTCL